MDFRKLQRSSSPITDYDYKCLKGMDASFFEYKLSSLNQNFIKQLLGWKVLTQTPLLPDHPINSLGKGTFSNTLEKNIDLSAPNSIHLAVTESGDLLGSAGFSSLDWAESHSKLYIFLDPKQSSEPRVWGRLISIVLHLLMRCAFTHFNFSKVSIETPNSDIVLVHTIEASGFRREAEFKDYTIINTELVDMIYASCTKESYLRTFPES